VCQVAVIGEILATDVNRMSFLGTGDQLAGGEPCHQAARPRQRPRLDQPAHLGIEPRHDGMNIAKLATDQAKRCELFKIGRADRAWPGQRILTFGAILAACRFH
jgi:hypothetical protein